MKKLAMILSVALMSVSAFADYQRVTLNGTFESLSGSRVSCGGYVRAYADASRFSVSEDTTITVEFRDVQDCSKVEVLNTGERTKLRGGHGDKDRNVYINAGRLRDGWNNVRIRLESRSGKHHDLIEVPVYVNPSYTAPSNNFAVCEANVKAAAIKRYWKRSGWPTFSIDTTNVHTSKKGNWVFTVYVNFTKYSITTDPRTCEVLN